MDKERKVMISIVVVVFVCGILGAIFAFSNIEHPRINIMVREINKTPASYLGTALEPDSVLCQAYRLGKNKKWQTNYRYAYELPAGSGFGWSEYLEKHPENAVDGGLNCHVIFSNSLPPATEKYFIVKETILAKK